MDIVDLQWQQITDEKMDLLLFLKGGSFAMGVRQIAMHNYNKEVFTAKRKALRKSFPAIK